jgi:low temperature requirement protein LtrA
MAGDHSGAAAGTPHAAERHATWIELFFDLIVVAGVGQLAHLLSHGPSPGDLGLYTLLFLAFWIAWASFTVYGNVAGDRIRIGYMLLAMVGLAVMVAAVPGIRHEHTRAFVIAYVVLRWLAGFVYRRGEVVVDWPLAQYGGGAVPWLISLFAAEPARYWLWSLGIAFDLFALVGASGSDVLRNAQWKMDRAVRRRGLPPGKPVPAIRAARTETTHLAERMGLFVIIVLGEGVAEVLAAASGVTWGRMLEVVGIGAFAIGTYFIVDAVSGLVSHTPRLRLLGWTVPGIVVPIVLGTVGHRLATGALIWLLAAVVIWQSAHEPLTRRRVGHRRGDGRRS